MANKNSNVQDRNIHRKLSHEELKAQRRKDAGYTEPTPTSPTTYGKREVQVFCVFKFVARPDDRVRMLPEGKYVVGTVGQSIPGYEEVKHSRTLHLGRARLMVVNLRENKGLGGFVQAKAGEVQESLRRLRARVIARYHEAQRLASIGFWDRYEEMLSYAREARA